MFRSLSLLTAICACSASAKHSDGDASTHYFVAVDGNDRWSGTLPQPNAAMTDGPFATLARARDAIRERKSLGRGSEGATVEMRGGSYSLDAPFDLAAADSGRSGAPVVYRAYRGERVRIRGTKVVTNLGPVTDAATLQRLDRDARGKVMQADLSPLGIADLGSAGDGTLKVFGASQPLRIARWPNEGFVRIQTVDGREPVTMLGVTGDRSGTFTYEGQRPERWSSEPDVWLHGYWFWDWSESRQRVDTIDVPKHSITLGGPQHAYGYRAGQWYYAYNILSELDTPGEWYVDRQTKTLYVWPPSEGAIEVAVASELLHLRDVSNVSFEGIELDGARGDGVVIEDSSDVTLDRCVVRNTSGWGVRVSGGARVRLADSEVANTGLGGISLKGGSRKSLEPAGHEADNNYVHDFSSWKRTVQPGIELDGVGNRATHNLLERAPHIAIWFAGNDHLIEMNEIRNVCTEVNDGGAIYAGRDWTMRGTQIRNNFLHDISGFEGKGCNGVMLDDMFSGTSVVGNVFLRVGRGILVGGGRDNTIANNIFVDCPDAITIDARALGWAAYQIAKFLVPRLEAMPYQSEPWLTRYPRLADLLKDEPALPKGNVVRRNVSVGGRWKVNDKARPVLDLEGNLIDVEPGFVDRARGDLRLRDDGRARREGIEPIPFDQIGLRRPRPRS